MPPPPTTPATAEYDRKLIASTVSAPTRPARASRTSTRGTICVSEAPIACAASMTPRGTSRRHCSTRRAKYGIAAKDSGTAAASGPIEVPAITRVIGTSATSRMMKGKLRTVFTTALIRRCSRPAPRWPDSDWPGLSRNSSTPSGPPNSTAAPRPMASIRPVWPSAVQISGSSPMRFSSMADLPASDRRDHFGGRQRRGVQRGEVRRLALQPRELQPQRRARHARRARRRRTARPAGPPR